MGGNDEVLRHCADKAAALTAKLARGDGGDVDMVQLGFNLRPLVDWRASTRVGGPPTDENAAWNDEVRRIWKAEVRPLLAERNYAPGLQDLLQDWGAPSE
eukprot:TRINITY_DN9542_c0_g1_i2.p2 TRINITY_DN9542_c0_g1~~TRINITY_DN9542_c0_g1_i2.p2  ORF type:complete len:100 (+),score=27.74 TRINITY_DN9542_c0_g1_i2:75-374(+)